MIVIAISIPTTVMAGNVKPKVVSNLFAWLNTNLNYPTSAIENKEEGTVYVAFTISESGQAENIDIRAGISEALNNEAISAVMNMPLIELYDADQSDKEFILPIKFSIQ